MNYLCNATELSDYIVDKCYDNGRKITNLKLQQILYVIQMIYCNITEGRLLFPERFVATEYGPKIPEIRDRYNPYLCTPRSRFTRTTIKGESIRGFIDEGIRFVFSTSPWRIYEVLEKVGTPWHTAYLRDDKIIDYEEFIRYYG